MSDFGKPRPLGRRGLGLAAGLLMAWPGAARPQAAPRRVRIGLFPDGSCPAGPVVAAFERWLGRKPDLGLDFIDMRLGWDGFLTSANWILGCWQGTHDPLVLSVPMLMQEADPSLRRGAEGAYDRHFRGLAETLIAHGQAGAILRLGWEFNGDWFHWAAERDPDAFVAFWRRIVDVMRGARSARFRFDWNPILGGTGPLERVYPGDDAVDIIGLDTYNQSWPRMRDPARRWRYLLDHAAGLRWHRDFAAAHGKPRSFPEWGTGMRPDGHGGGDDPLFIRNMLAWMQEGGPVEYACYWDVRAEDYDAKVSDGRLPQAAAALRAGLRPPMTVR